jgi:hypothetical protein
LPLVCYTAPSCLPRPLDHRIADAGRLKAEVDAWRTRRNTHNTTANWHTTTADARVKLKSLHPSLEEIQAGSLSTGLF